MADKFLNNNNFENTIDNPPSKHKWTTAHPTTATVTCNSQTDSDTAQSAGTTPTPTEVLLLLNSDYPNEEQGYNEIEFMLEN